ncbi:hypothetical protein H5410_030167 [Solanum commersonii]|uniref:Uncharacterized protein n=1 Tax=Solanum commersonii TaxID=4109 RepID=A0A9J5YFC8_SOLCO|nr:hypothetical protein H5410_030167 [Solanum commersonii]
MVRTPCCEKVGLKRGRWTVEEDERLTNYIQANGEGSWRTLPKNAGNITSEEEAIIIKLCETLGNSRKVESLRIPSDEKLPQAVVELAKKGTQQQIIKQRRKGKTKISGSNFRSETAVHITSSIPNMEKETINTIPNGDNKAMKFDHNDDQMLWHDDIMLMDVKDAELDQDFIFNCL